MHINVKIVYRISCKILCMCSYKRLSCHFGASILFAMSALFLLLAVTVLLNSSVQVEVDTKEDEYLMEEFRNLFSEYLQKPVEERPPKRIRDTSKTDGHLKDRIKTGKISSAETVKPKLSSLYPCNYNDSAAKLCINIRQLGTTLTIGVLVEGMDAETPPIQWYRVFKVRGQSEEKSLSFVKLSRGNLPWNINLGGNNNELRISPITETDFSYNFFLATLDEGSPESAQGQNKGHLQLMMFRIEPISINMGTLYHGEEITINIHSHMELPSQSVQYEWSRIGPDFEPRQDLPSNMKLSRDGSVLIIKEHRNYGDMILTCTVYSNKNFTLGRRNFFLKKIVPTPSPNLPFRNGIKRKRRSLEKFYVEPFWDTERRFPKYKRDSDQLEITDSILDYETQTITYDQEREFKQMPLILPETSSSARPTSHSSIIPTIRTRKKTMLNFYANTPFENMFATELEEKQPAKPLDDLIKQANSMVEPNDDRMEQKYPTHKMAEEKLTFEDKESMLIADCNDDADCGINAVCSERTPRFCKCLPHYRGNGMFCWMF